MVDSFFGRSGETLLSGYRTVPRTVLPNSWLVLLAEFGGRFSSRFFSTKKLKGTNLLVDSF